jgi:3-hydroxyacyl-CoA dehydrogenase/enoyl-CoA hydratase/3-hydroxybutyryl-CoA epimerase
MSAVTSPHTRGALDLQWEDNLALLAIDVPGESMNTMGANFPDELHRVLDEVEKRRHVRGMVVFSRKLDSFVAGANIDMLAELGSAQSATFLSRTAQDALNRLERVAFPVVAAIHGACLGGGLEFALACRGRVASDDGRTVMGLPEVQLGLIPGAGGTQRLPRLVGIQTALDMILTGKRVRAVKAKKLGLVDEVVPATILVETAKQRVALLSEHDGRAARSASRVELAREWLLSQNRIGRKMVFSQARKAVMSRTQGHYPAPLQALQVVQVGLEHGMEQGLDAEARTFGDLVMSPVARQLIFMFHATQALKKDSGVDDPSVRARPVSKVGVLGAGLMGGGIAFVTADKAELSVRLKDKDDEAVRRGLRHVRDLLETQVSKKRLSPRDAERVAHRVLGTSDYSGFADVDVVIEAVFEDLSVKHRVVQDVERHGKPDVIFASNTSSLPITRIAEASQHPQTVIGMHYFSPVEKMPLLEIITTKHTAPWVTATCVELGKQQGKTVIVVRDGAGFYTSRILAPYINEAMFMVEQGVPVDAIDRALVKFGFPVGPVVLLDEVGIDVAAKVSHIMHEAFGSRMVASRATEKLLADQRYGKKNKRGFYSYIESSRKRKKGPKEVDDTVYPLLGVTPHRQLPEQEIQERCVLAMVNEAILCLQEGILRHPRDGDVGAVFGLGFPPFLGGPFRYADAMGLAVLVGKLQHYQAAYGARFAPASLLIERAEQGKKFHR